MIKTKVKERRGYGLQTVRSLIENLKKYVEESDYLDMDSPIFISDYAMSGYKHEFDVLPTFSPYMHKAGLCLFHSLGEEKSVVSLDTSNTPSEEIEEEEVAYDLETETLEEPSVEPSTRGISKFMKWYKEN